MRNLLDFKTINGDTEKVNIVNKDEEQNGEDVNLYDRIINWANSGTGELIIAVFFMVVIFLLLLPIFIRMFKLFFIEIPKTKLSLYDDLS
tara:strand:+ start:305 stop:574 length:270 start_codon:yes stop_codon:yes gene_type:complete